MILGMSISAFTSPHVLISLVGLGSGVIAVYGILHSRVLHSWTSIFLWSTALTSATGFLFPFDHLDPALIVGIISLIVLAVTIVAISGFQLVRAWRWIFVVTVMTALYLNAFVFVVQAFNKLPPLRALAPTGTESPFAVAQIFLLALFVLLSFFAVTRFQPENGQLGSFASQRRA